MKDREHRQGRKFKCEVDTNVMSIKLNTLKEEADYATGDPVVCSGCSAVFNINSKLEANPEGDQLWTCEFWGVPNEVVVDEQEVPKNETVIYVLEDEKAAKANEEMKEDKDKKKKAKNEDAPIIFWLDVSGSMKKGQALNQANNKSNFMKINVKQGIVLLLLFQTPQ